MPRIVRIVRSTIIVVSLAATLTAQGRQPSQSSPDHPQYASDKLNELAARAAKAKGNISSEAVELTDGVMAFLGLELPVNVATTSIRGRLYRAEQDFRLGRVEGISEQKAVEAINRLAADLDAPDWARTNLSQIRAFRGMLRPSLPALIGAGGKGGQFAPLPRHMAPAEALLVVTYLTSGKMHDRAFRVRPEEWVKQRRQQLPRTPESRRRGPANATAAIQAAADEFQTLAWAWKYALAKGDADVTRRTNQFLDSLGFGR